MNRFQAADYFRKGDLIGYFKNKPLGQLPSASFVECINHAQGQELDDMIDRCLQLTRTEFLGNLETDVDYRARGVAYAQALDICEVDFLAFKGAMADMEDIVGGYDLSTCNHQWRLYHGLFETDEYCIICNRKKQK